METTDSAAHVGKQVKRLMDENAKLHVEYGEEIMKLHSKNVKLRSELEKQGAELQECRAQNDRQQKELLREMELFRLYHVAALNKNQTYQETLMQLTETNAKLVSEINSASKKLRKFEESSDVISGSVCEKLKIMMEENDHLRAEYSAEVMKLQSKIAQLSSELIKKDVDLGGCQGQSAQLRSEYSAEVMKLQSKIAQLSSELIKKDVDLEECQAQTEQLRSEYSAEVMKLQSKIAQLSSELTKKDVDLEECQAQSGQHCRQLLSEIQTEIVDDGDDLLSELKVLMDKAISW